MVAGAGAHGRLLAPAGPGGRPSAGAATVDEAVRRLAELGLHATGPGVLAAAEEAEAALAAVDGRWDDALVRYERAAQGWEVGPALGAGGRRVVRGREAARRGRAVAGRRARRPGPGGRRRARPGPLPPPGRGAADRVRGRRTATRPAARPLTPRELEIARLVAEGRTNKEIGDALYLSEKTVRNVLSPVFAKLGVTRRSEVAALLARLEA